MYTEVLFLGKGVVRSIYRSDVVLCCIVHDETVDRHHFTHVYVVHMNDSHCTDVKKEYRYLSPSLKEVTAEGTK